MPELAPEKRALYAKINLVLLAFITVCCLLVGRKCAQEHATPAAREPRSAPIRPPGEFEPKTPADQARCGPKPELSPLEGELVGAERFLARTVPGEIDVRDCTNPIFLDGHAQDCWRSTCSVRAALGVDERVMFFVTANEIQRSQRAP